MENILISACLLGINCKYNAENNKLNDEIINSLKEKYNLIPFCPEILGGMPTPRNPVEIRNGSFVDYDGQHYTDKFVKGAEESLKLAELFKVKTAILKEKSPSCGSNYIYDGNFTGKKIKGMGITAQKFFENEIELFSEENIKILL